MATGADAIVKSLEAEGCDRIFLVPGESYLATLNALAGQNAIQLVTCRHEGGAGFMAIADAKLTGKPGVAFVSRGPGATNASIAVHTAEQDAVPFILFIGQVSRDELGRKAFQEVDYAKTFADMAKGVWTIMDAGQAPEVIARAWQVAQSGTPGPVVVVLPEDMQFDETDAQPAGPLPVPASPAAASVVADAAQLLARSNRPLMIVGGGVDSNDGRAALIRAAEHWQIPVITSFKRQDLFPNDNRLYAGNLGFNIPQPHVDLLSDTDLILAVGTRLGDTTTQGYKFPSMPPKQTLVHVYANADEIGRNFRTDLGVAADPISFLDRLIAENPVIADQTARDQWVERLKAYIDNLMDADPAPAEDGVNFGLVITELKSYLTDNTIFVTDAGNFSSWLHRHIRFNGRQRLLGAVSGAMGIGLPAAAAAALREPETQVLCFLGDGGAMMTGNELATALQYGANIKVFVSNNGSYGTIRLHQEKYFPGRKSGTDLVNPDFAKWAEAFGATGLKISTDADIAPVMKQVFDTNGPVVVETLTSLERISAYVSISDLGK